MFSDPPSVLSRASVANPLHAFVPLPSEALAKEDLCYIIANTHEPPPPHPPLRADCDAAFAVMLLFVGSVRPHLVFDQEPRLKNLLYPPANTTLPNSFIATVLPGGKLPDSTTNFVYCLSFGNSELSLPDDFMARFANDSFTVRTDDKGIAMQPARVQTACAWQRFRYSIRWQI